jgi:transcriptional regulator with XRE-family HTH domain
MNMKQNARKAIDYAGETADTLAAIGDRIRDLRVSQRLTLQELGLKTGLSPSMLSLMERGKASPSIGSLIVVCAALGVHMTDLMASGRPPLRDPVSRAAKQPVLETAKGVRRRVMREDDTRGIEVALNEYLPKTASAPEPIRHPGFEYGVVIEGQLIVSLDGTDHVLGEGDLISYESTRLHRIRNGGKARARALWINLGRG